MIKRIILRKVTSYKNETSLETDKKVNLIYGLNGTGKTTLSNYLYSPDDTTFADCSIEWSEEEKEILVYNQKFIHDYFYQPDSLKGIFTLSKENKKALETIKNRENEKLKLLEQKTEKEKERNKIENALKDIISTAENKTWEIKTKYAGGDRVLEYCLEGYMGSKKALFEKLLQIEKPKNQLASTIEDLKKEVESIKGDSAKKYDLLPIISFNGNDVESNLLFQKQISGNDNSSVAKLIKKLDNADWVKDGIDFFQASSDKCPFCQQDITPKIIKNIKDFFDEEYENNLNKLKTLQSNYNDSIANIHPKTNYKDNPFIAEQNREFDSLYNDLLTLLTTNKTAIKNKIASPSKVVALQSTSESVKNLNDFLEKINTKINEHNKKIDNKENTLQSIKSKFWDIMRWNYDQTISIYIKEHEKDNQYIQSISKEVASIEKSIEGKNEIISTAQKETVNIDEAINNINNGLIGLGIDSFSIEKHGTELYQIKRTKQCDFSTLSEGEKMIISFLYFCELCEGRKTATSPSLEKVVVVDDPISSLSHIWVFNVGQIIKTKFFNSRNYKQVFVLTHSLYFFYELTDTKHERRRNSQKLFRIIKNAEGSKILTMAYEEIQNDYHSYWSIIKDDRQPPVLIANCMRNIIDYFFNFVEKKDFNNVFQKPELQQTKYQAFCRYMNRESHSLGQNIFDIKEFDYTVFKEALKLVFEKNGYSEHYLAMTR